MIDDLRQHRRIEKPLTMHYCLADVLPIKWDITSIGNISIGGVKFIARNDLNLNHKTVLLQIKIPQLAPDSLVLEAIVLNVKPRPNTKTSDVRAKFINLSETDKEQLSVVGKVINSQYIKNTPKDDGKKT